MPFSKIMMSVALFAATLVSAAAVPNDAVEARCTKCKNDNDCANGTPFYSCSGGCCNDY